MTTTRIGKGSLSTTLGDIDTAAVPAATLRVVKALTLCNNSTTAQTVSIDFAGTRVISSYTVPAIGNENTITIPFMDQVMLATERIQGLCSSSSTVNYYISGKEMGV